MWHSRSSWKRPVLSVHSSSHASVAFVCRHHWPYIDICVHLFTCTLCCACRIVLLDCTLIIALEREHSQCVVCVQSRCFFSPSSSAWTLDPLVICWRQNCCLPEPLCNAWRDHVYLIFSRALTPEQWSCLMKTTVARVKPNFSVGQTEPLN